MPRPKRSRVASSSPPHAVAVKRINAPLVSAAVRSEPEGETSSDIYDLSDREKERTKQRKLQGGSAAAGGQTASVRTGETRPTHRTTTALEDARRERDEAMARLAAPTSTTASTRPDARELSDVDSPPPMELGRSAPADVRRSHTDVSGLDLDDDVFGRLDDSFGDDSLALEEDETRPTHNSTGTSSSFNVALFKRRRRQSSIVGRDDAPIRPSSRGPNTPSISATLNLGNFKRRAREPSILGTAQKARAPRPVSRASHDSDADAALESDTSMPAGNDDAEKEDAEPGAASPQRDALPVRSSRKRKSLEEHDGREKRRSLDGEERIHQSIESDSELSELDMAVALTSPDEPHQTPVSDDPAMAPPLSSSSSDASPGVWPPLDALARRQHSHRRPTSKARKTPELELDDGASDMSSPPSLTHSPNYAAAKRKGKARKAASRPKKAPTTTATLASLLPRRRHKQVSTIALDDDGSSSEDVDEDVDELSRAPSRKKRARPLAPTSGGKAAASSNASSAKKGGRRTYGSSNWDKENEDDAALGDRGAITDREGDEVDPAQFVDETGELKKAAEKFKEVDKWELDFEEVTGSSSPGVAA